MSDYKSSDFTPSAFNPHIKVVFSNYYPEITDNLIKSIKLAIQEHKKEYAPYNLTLTDHTEFHTESVSHTSRNKGFLYKLASCSELARSLALMPAVDRQF